MAPLRMMQPYPFTAIVGQEEMKRALVLTAIDPGIGGVLVFGDRGTGKSTAVRALAALLPNIRAVAGCPVNSATARRRPRLGRGHLPATSSSARPRSSTCPSAPPRTASSAPSTSSAP